MSRYESDRLRARLKSYSNAGLNIGHAVRNTNTPKEDMIAIAEKYGWYDELAAMFPLNGRNKGFEPSGHEGIRHLQVSELAEFVPQLQKRLVVRALTAPWNLRSIKKEVLLYGRAKKADRHA